VARPPEIDEVNFTGVRALDARTPEQRSTVARQTGEIETPRTGHKVPRAANAELEARIARLEALASARPAP
jgi:hypothetical protein